MNTQENEILTRLITSLENLSLPYNQQIGKFPEFVDLFDELILDFDDAFRLLPALMDNQLVSYEAVKEILRCNNLIELNLSTEDRKTDESFENDEAWNLVREYAGNAVTILKKS